MKKTFTLLTFLFAFLFSFTFAQRGQQYSGSVRVHQPQQHIHNHQCTPPMDAHSFSRALAHISAQRFSHDKLDVALSVVEMNTLTSDQVLQVLSTFTFDSDKEKLAKAAWRSVCDPGNFYLVFSSFRFNCTTMHVQDFMKCNPRPASSACCGSNMGVMNTARPATQGASSSGVAIIHGHNCTCHPRQVDDFGRFMGMFNNESFDTGRLSLAKSYLNNRSLSADQIRQMVGGLTFESHKLELAKYAYSYCFDPQNYYLINSAFTFSSSGSELNRFIRG